MSANPWIIKYPLRPESSNHQQTSSIIRKTMVHELQTQLKTKIINDFVKAIKLKKKTLTHLDPWEFSSPSTLDARLWTILSPLRIMEAKFSSMKVYHICYYVCVTVEPLYMPSVNSISYNLATSARTNVMRCFWIEVDWELDSCNMVFSLINTKKITYKQD